MKGRVCKIDSICCFIPIILLISSFFFSWVSGIGSVHHPQVWTACVSYTKSSSLSDRVWGDSDGNDGGGGGSFLLLVYAQGTTQPSYWQCSAKTGRDGMIGLKNVPFEVASGDTSIEVQYYAGNI